MKQRSDMHTKMRGRNLAVLAVILFFVVLVAVLTYIKMGGGA